MALQPAASGHFINPDTPCPVCGKTDALEVRNYRDRWRDGEVWCARCNQYVRGYAEG